MSHAATDWAVRQRGISAVEARVLWHLADCHNPVLGCFPSQAYLADNSEVDERTVRRTLVSLRSKRLISWDDSREGNRRGNNRYRLAFEPDFEPFQPDNLSGSDCASTGHSDASQPDKSDRLNRTPESAEPVIEPVTEPEREVRAGAVGQEGEIVDAGEDDGDDRPGTAAFEKRVMRFCNGRGFVAGAWPDWDTSSLTWIGAHFAKLSPSERADAERWRDAYLLDIAARKRSPVKVGVFLRDRHWTGLDPMLLARAEKQKSAQLAPAEQTKPDGWAACLGPVGMAWLFAKLLAGPADAKLMGRPLLTDPVLRQAWPAVWWWQAMQRQKGGAVFDPPWHELRPAMEFVPKGTDVLAAWRQEFEARGWRWLNALDAGDGVYCPKGGPDGLPAFRQAVEGLTRDDAAGSEAAE